MADVLLMALVCGTVVIALAVDLGAIGGWLFAKARRD
jgi:hypothetical protein